jgi:hypothetical protein
VADRKCIVRAFADEPQVMYAVRGNALRVEVTRKRGVYTLSLPRDCVFEYDHDVLLRLREASAAPSRTSLAVEWSRCKRIVLPIQPNLNEPGGDCG